CRSFLLSYHQIPQTAANFVDLNIEYCFRDGRSCSQVTWIHPCQNLLPGFVLVGWRETFIPPANNAIFLYHAYEFANRFRGVIKEVHASEVKKRVEGVVGKREVLGVAVNQISISVPPLLTLS